MHVFLIQRKRFLGKKKMILGAGGWRGRKCKPNHSDPPCSEHYKISLFSLILKSKDWKERRILERSKHDNVIQSICPKFAHFNYLLNKIHHIWRNSKHQGSGGPFCTALWYGQPNRGKKTSAKS